MPLTLLLGGARSGKTSLAVEMATRRRCSVAYVATAPTIDGDIDLAERVSRHRSERPADWTTIEEELDLSGAVARADAEFVDQGCPSQPLGTRPWEPLQIHPVRKLNDDRDPFLGA